MPLLAHASTDYYAGKLGQLEDLFGEPVRLEDGVLAVGRARYPIVDDVIVLLDPAQWPDAVRKRAGERLGAGDAGPFSADTQFSFGAEWTDYPAILPEHRDEFAAYFDLIEPGSLRGLRAADLGCGSGRWSHFLAPLCREIVLVDFSEAIFVARENLRAAPNALFFMGDVTQLPFRRNFCDLAFSLGVLHHLPVSALDAVIGLRDAAPRLLVYLYYALDNRPMHFRAMLWWVTLARRALARVHHRAVRRAIAKAIAATVYMPFVAVGRAASAAGLERFVPLYDTYKGKSLRRIEQDAYDRFFTPIEQRVSRRDIVARLSPHFGSIIISDGQPWWHFLCLRDR
jgi:SAM-dependent methyltransferase